MAAEQVVVDQPHGLHEGIHDGGSHELEAALLEIPAQGLGLGGHGRHLVGAGPVVHPRLAAAGAPQVGVEAAEGLLDGQEGPGVAHRRGHLEPVAHHPGVLEDRRAAFRAEPGHRRRIEAGEGPAVGLPLAQDRDPAEPGLGPLQDQHLEQPAVVVQRHPPLQVVVRHVERIDPAPAAADRRLGFVQGFPDRHGFLRRLWIHHKGDTGVGIDLR